MHRIKINIFKKITREIIKKYYIRNNLKKLTKKLVS